MKNIFRNTFISAGILSSFALTSISFADEFKNNLEIIYTQSEYNPHLNDKVSADASSLVKVESGLMRGSHHDGIYQYLGVPYAEALERFVRATPVKPWKGIFNALSYGQISEQQIFGTSEPLKGVATGNNVQNLNIWTPSLNTKSKKPVMVWLHGGGFSSGSANEAQYHGENLSRIGDVVVVGVNHRLNALGFLDLSEFSEKYRDSANIGMLDIIDALRWIKNNIENFGGDPNNVTIFGESGGGSKVLALMSTPSAKDLFHKGIVESGSDDTMGIVFNPKLASLSLTHEILKELKVDKNSIESLQSIPLEVIWNAFTKVEAKVAEHHNLPVSITPEPHMEWAPETGTELIPYNPVSEKGFAPSGKDIPLLIGSNLTEWASIFPFVKRTSLTEEQRNLFSKAYPDKDPELVKSVDTYFRLPLLKIMLNKADQKRAPVYAYVFAKEHGKDLSYHAIEIPYIFSNSKNDSKLNETMSKLWSSFARTGVPSAKGVPEWKAFDRNYRATMILDEVSTLRINHDKELLESLVPDYEY